MNINKLSHHYHHHHHYYYYYYKYHHKESIEKQLSRYDHSITPRVLLEKARASVSRAADKQAKLLEQV